MAARRSSPARAGSSARGWPRRCSSAGARWSRSTAAARSGRLSTLALLGIEQRVAAGASGDLGDGSRWSGRCASTGSSDVFHLARRDDRRHGRRVAARARSRPTSAAPGPCSTPACERGRRAGRGRLVGQGLRSPRRAPVPRGLRAAADGALRGVEGGRRHDRAQLLAGYGLPVAVTRFANIYGGGDLQLLADRPRGGLRGDRGPGAGAALRRLARARLPLRRGRGVAHTSRSPTTSTATRSGARRSTPAAGGRIASATSSR